MKLLIALVAGIAVASASYEVEQFIVNGNNKFTLDLFGEVAKANPDKSIVMSGSSAMSPLTLLGFASRGPSQDEIFKAIGMPNDTGSMNELFAFAYAKFETLKLERNDDPKGIVLKTANSIFIPNGYEINDGLNAFSKKTFRSEVKQVDFSKNAEAALTINSWVEANTNNRIKDLVSAQSLGPATQAVLVNALYFKGNWLDQEKFDPAFTKDDDFYVTKDKTIKVPTMFRHGDYHFLNDKELDAKFLRIPYYGYGGNATFLVALPNQVDGIAALTERLKDPSVFVQMTRNLTNHEVDVYLPKFKIETSIDLKDVLQKIGVKSIFNAAVSGIKQLVKSGEIFIDKAIQKVFIEINEEGAEAAAASGFFGFGSSLFVPEKQTFKADHPFLFFIMLKENILFNGAYYGQDD